MLLSQSALPSALPLLLLLLLLLPHDESDMNDVAEEAECGRADRHKNAGLRAPGVALMANPSSMAFNRKWGRRDCRNRAAERRTTNATK